jgi:hypothetical protein
MEHKKSNSNHSKFAEVTKKAQEERAKKPKQSRESPNHFAPRPEERSLDALSDDALLAEADEILDPKRKTS